MRDIMYISKLYSILPIYTPQPLMQTDSIELVGSAPDTYITDTAGIVKPQKMVPIGLQSTALQVIMKHACRNHQWRF